MIEQQVEAFMRQWNMAPPGTRVLAAVSGGADSVCLCLVLSELAARMGISVEAVHVEHGIRGEESRQDAAFVERFCAQHGLVCHRRDVCVPEYAAAHGLGEEEAARILRYRVFAELARQRGARVALAHHIEDDAETLLFQLVRGSGLDGLCGMRPVRTDEAGVCYIRPFLSVSRAQIETELSVRGQPFRTDSTNADLRCSRNRIRKNVLPELSAVNERAAAHIHAAAQQLAAVRDYMQEQEDALAEEMIRRTPETVTVSVSALLAQPEAMRTRLLKRAAALAAGGSRDLTSAHIQAVDALLHKQSGRRIALPLGVSAQRVYDTIVFEKERGAAAAVEFPLFSKGGFPEAFSACGWEFSFRVFPFDGDWKKIPRKQYTKWFDYGKIKDSLTVRNGRDGDRLLLDSAGHHKKLKDYFTDEKIPPARRAETLLFAQGSDIIWIVGGRMAYGSGISEDTRQVLEINAAPARA